MELRALLGAVLLVASSAALCEPTGFGFDLVDQTGQIVGGAGFTFDSAPVDGHYDALNAGQTMTADTVDAAGQLHLYQATFDGQIFNKPMVGMQWFGFSASFDVHGGALTAVYGGGGWYEDMAPIGYVSGGAGFSGTTWGYDVEATVYPGMDGSLLGAFGSGGGQIVFASAPVQPTPVPEPATVWLVGLGLAGLGLARCGSGCGSLRERSVYADKNSL